MQNLLAKAISLIYENSCLICNSSSQHSIVCKSCENSFALRNKTYAKSFQEITVFSWGMYEGKLREAIIGLKAGKKKLANYFSEKLIEFWNTLPRQIKNKNYVVTSIPSHKKRIRERGYCQSSLIALNFAKVLGLNFQNIAARKKETLFMNSLSNLSERLENIRDAFEITRMLIKENNILIIDDILTSGSTICELAKTIHAKFPEAHLTGLTIAAGDTYPNP